MCNYVVRDRLFCYDIDPSGEKSPAYNARITGVETCRRRIGPGESIADPKNDWCRKKSDCISQINHPFCSNPHRVLEYEDANRFQFVELNFVILVFDGILTTGNKTAEFLYFFF